MELHKILVIIMAVVFVIAFICILWSSIKVEILKRDVEDTIRRNEFKIAKYKEIK